MTRLFKLPRRCVPSLGSLALASVRHTTAIYRSYVALPNGKLERWHGTLKKEDFRHKAPQNLDEARRVVGDFVTHYNEVRLHSALGYVTPHDMLAGRAPEIFANRDSKLEAARSKRLGAKARSAVVSPDHPVVA